jgi:hypothetical protein
MTIATKPPPPSPETVRLKGRCRSEKLKRTEIGRVSNGRLNEQPSETLLSVKMPTPIAGSASE